MPPGRADAVEAVAARLAAGGRVLVTGERGSGRTSVAAAAAPRAARGTGLRLLQVDGLTLRTALRDEPRGDRVLVVDDVQWADAESRVALADVDGPLLLTALEPADGLDHLGRLTTVRLPPLDDRTAAELVGADEARLRRAGGNLRLLDQLRPGTPPAGPALRVLRLLLDDLDPDARETVLLHGVAGAALPLDLRPAAAALLGAGVLSLTPDGVRLRVGALGEVAVARAGRDALVRAHAEVAALVPPARAPAHLLAAGDADGARAAAVAAAAADGLSPTGVADLLLLAVRATGTPLDEELTDRLAECLWQCWRLDELLAAVPLASTARQGRVVALARAARGEPLLGVVPRGAADRAAVAAGGHPARVAADGDGALAAAAAALLQGDTRPVVVPADDEQRWQAAALDACAALLDGTDPAPLLLAAADGLSSSPTRRWTACCELLAAAAEAVRGGASRRAEERLAAALAGVPPPVPAWGWAVLALVRADLGDALEAVAALESAAPTAAVDRQLLALAGAEVELTTGRPRRALRLLEQPVAPVLRPAQALLRGWCLRTVGEPVAVTAVGEVTACGRAARDELVAVAADDPDAYRTAAQAWDGVWQHRAVLCRWAAADAAARAGWPDVEELRELEGLADERGWLPLLARVRDTLRRAGHRPTRTASRAEPRGALSARELEVMELVRDGFTSAQVATRLGVAPSTVETQVAAAMRKLGARTRRHAVALLAAGAR